MFSFIFAWDSHVEIRSCILRRIVQCDFSSVFGLRSPDCIPRGDVNPGPAFLLGALSARGTDRPYNPLGGFGVALVHLPSAPLPGYGIVTGSAASWLGLSDTLGDSISRFWRLPGGTADPL